jgi:hypothetical protein
MPACFDIHWRVASRIAIRHHRHRSPTATGTRMKSDLLEREFAPRGVANAGGLLLLRPQDAVELVNSAADEGVPIIGVEGFFVTPAGTEASPDHIADYSAMVAQGHGCWQDAESFIRERTDSALVFEIVLGDDPIEAV